MKQQLSKWLLSTRYSLLARSRGYIAIVSALIISIIMAIVLVSLGQVSFFHRINISNAHLKEKSRALAGACVDAALLKIVNSSTYAGNETITVASDTCKIVSVVTSGTVRVVTTQGIYQNSYTNLRVDIPTSTVSITGWEETQN